MQLDHCTHYGSVSGTQPCSAVCAECGLTAPIRVCLTCGHVGCCDSTRGHATAHATASGHPVIRSLPLSEQSFTWCYACNDYLT